MSAIDFFGTHAPTFYLGGKHKVNTCPGGMLSIVMITILLVFSSLKLTKLIHAKNPTLSTVLIEQNFEPEHKIDLIDKNFKIAIAI